MNKTLIERHTKFNTAGKLLILSDDLYEIFPEGDIFLCEMDDLGQYAFRMYPKEDIHFYNQIEVLSSVYEVIGDKNILQTRVDVSEGFFEFVLNMMTPMINLVNIK